jgi:hypothetical protein
VERLSLRWEVLLPGLLIRSAAVFGLLLLTHATGFAGCQHSVTSPWKSAGASGLTLQATSFGEVCGKTAVVLTVADKDGHVIWSTSRLAEYVSIFAADGPVTEGDVKKALAEWIDIGQQGALTRTGKLPDWPAGAEAPRLDNEEGFGFVAGEDVSRAFYLEQRKADVPLFCFVQGMESESCIIFTKDKAVLDFGGTRFPG